MFAPWTSLRSFGRHFLGLKTWNAPSAHSNSTRIASSFPAVTSACMCQSHMRKMVWRPKACTSVHTGSLAAGITGNSIYRLQKRSLRSGQFTDSLCRLFSQNKNKVGNSVAKKSAIWKKNDFTENHNHSSTGIYGLKFLDSLKFRLPEFEKRSHKFGYWNSGCGRTCTSDI